MVLGDRKFPETNFPPSDWCKWIKWISPAWNILPGASWLLKLIAAETRPPRPSPHRRTLTCRTLGSLGRNQGVWGGRGPLKADPWSGVVRGTCAWVWKSAPSQSQPKKSKKKNWSLFRLTDRWLWRRKGSRPETEKCLANPKSAKRCTTRWRTSPRAALSTPPPSPDTCLRSVTSHPSATPATCWPRPRRCTRRPASPSDLTTLPVWSPPWARVPARAPLTGLQARVPRPPFHVHFRRSSIMKPKLDGSVCFCRHQATWCCGHSDNAAYRGVCVLTPRIWIPFVNKPFRLTFPIEQGLSSAVKKKKKKKVTEHCI